jgi:hypothetical protein
MCTNHPERFGTGICTRCKGIFCGECLTKIDGINHCTYCLERLREKREVEVKRWESIFASIFLPLFLLLSAGGWVFFALLPPGIRYLDIRLKAPMNIARMEVIKSGLLSFYKDTEHLPAQDEGIEALITSDANGDGIETTGWNGPYLPDEEISMDDEGEILDVYGHPIKYIKMGEDKALVASMGANGRWETDLSNLSGGERGRGDDVVVWVLPSDLLFLEGEDGV